VLSPKNISLLLWCVLVCAVLGPATAQTTDSTRVVLLGTGTPNPDPERSGPSVAIVAGGTAYLVDAGPGLVRRAASLAAGFPALQAERLRTVFLTHLHSDHTVGLPDLIHTGWVAGRPVPLRVFGPVGTRAMAEHLTAAYQADITNRTTGLQPHTENGWKLDPREIAGSGGEIYRDSAVTVTAIPVHHDGWPEGTSFGYRFETRERVIVISGDAIPSEAIARACSGCDVLVHEVYAQKGFETRTADWKRYHADAHTSTRELAELAGRARPKLLVLYHQLYWGASDEDLIREIRAAGYAGLVVSGRDLGVY
jgi:ribonuclease BN (tRNA processing enzyme)